MSRGSTVLIVEAYEGAFVNFRKKFLDSLVALGYRIVVAAPSISTPIRAGLTDRRILATEFRMKRASSNPVQELRTILSLTALVRRVAPDIVVAFGPKTVIYSGLAVRLSGRPPALGVITGRGTGWDGGGVGGRVIARVQRVLYRLSLRNYQTVIFHNGDDRALFQEAGLTALVPRTGVVGGSGVDLLEFSPTPILATNPSFLFVGRLIRSKGIYEFLDAANSLTDKYPNASFSVAGWHDEGRADALSRAEFQALVNNPGIEYLGFLSDVRPALSDASVVVLPSYGEGTPRAVLEALAMRRAVAATDVPGCRDTVIHGKTGYLVDSRDSRALASAMERYIIDPATAIKHGEAGHALARRKYDVTRVNSVLLDMVSEILRT